MFKATLSAAVVVKETLRLPWVVVVEFIQVCGALTSVVVYVNRLVEFLLFEESFVKTRHLTVEPTVSLTYFVTLLQFCVPEKVTKLLLARVPVPLSNSNIYPLNAVSSVQFTLCNAHVPAPVPFVEFLAHLGIVVSPPPPPETFTVVFCIVDVITPPVLFERMALVIPTVEIPEPVALK